jgi:hypothetical protein
MTTPPLRVERRIGQRFPYLLPILLRQSSSSIEGVGFTQNLSSRGVFFFTDAPLLENAEIEITLNMPSEITLGETMRVRCRGRILRIIRPLIAAPDAAAASQTEAKAETAKAETKIGVAMRLEGYEYLPEASDSSSTFARVSSLHPQRDEDRLLDVGRPALH